MLLIQVSTSGVTYGLRFTAYFPCTTSQGRYKVLDATVFQPGPTHAAAFGPTVVDSLPPTSSEQIGWGADIGTSSRLRLTGVNFDLRLLAPSLGLEAWRPRHALHQIHQL